MRKTILNQRKEIFPEILNNKTKQNAKKEATNTNKHTKTKKYIPYIYIHTSKLVQILSMLLIRRRL